MKSIVEQLDFARIKESGARCTDAIARRDNLTAELARAEQAVAEFRALRAERNEAADAAKSAAAANFRKPTPKSKAAMEEAERTAKGLRAKVDELHPSAKAAHEALKEIRPELEEAEAAVAARYREVSSAIATWGQDGLMRTLGEITDRVDEVGALYAVAAAFSDLCLNHGEGPPWQFASLLSRWQNADRTHYDLGGLVVMDKGDGRIRAPAWLTNLPPSDAPAELRAAVEKAAGVAGGPKTHHYHDIEAGRRERENADLARRLGV